jgi:hypothetical protein
MRIDAPLPSWWRELFKASDDTSPDTQGALIDAVTAAGDGGLRALCAVLDPALAERPAPGATPRAREFCAWMLARFARPELVPWLFGRIDELGADDPVVPYLADALAACGADAATEACRRFADAAPGEPVRPWLAEVVARAGVRTDESLAVLVSYLADDPMHASRLLAAYGDPAALRAMLLEFDRTPTEGDDADPQTLVELGAAIGELGGLDSARAERLAACGREAREAAVAQRRRMIEYGGFGGPVPRPDDEDACPCESGAAYLRCCAEIEAELAERARLRRLRPRR